MRRSLFILLCSTLIASPVFAQAPAPALPKGIVPNVAPMPAPSATMIPAGDTDHDHKLSKAEWAAMQDKRFASMDANHDGFITADEFDKFVGAEITRATKK